MAKNSNLTKEQEQEIAKNYFLKTFNKENVRGNYFDKGNPEEDANAIKLILSLKELKGTSVSLTKAIDNTLDFEKKQLEYNKKLALANESNFKAYTRQNKIINLFYETTFKDFTTMFKGKITADNVKSSGVKLLAGMGLFGNYSSKIASAMEGFQDFKKSRNETKRGMDYVEEAEKKGATPKALEMMLKANQFTSSKIAELISTYQQRLYEQRDIDLIRRAKSEDNTINRPSEESDLNYAEPRESESSQNWSLKEEAIGGMSGDAILTELRNHTTLLESMGNDMFMANELTKAWIRQDAEQFNLRETKGKEDKKNGISSSIENSIENIFGASLGGFLARSIGPLLGGMAGFIGAIELVPTAIVGGILAMFGGAVYGVNKLFDWVRDEQEKDTLKINKKIAILEQNPKSKENDEEIERLIKERGELKNKTIYSTWRNQGKYDEKPEAAQKESFAVQQDRVAAESAQVKADVSKQGSTSNESLATLKEIKKLLEKPSTNINMSKDASMLRGIQSYSDNLQHITVGAIN